MRANKNKDFKNPPSSLKGSTQEQELIARGKDLDRIREAFYKGEEILITDQSDYYCGQKEFEVRYELRKLYHNKCAYCECVSYKPDVEHYRPKKKVTGPKGNKHGYYWLCYEWSNLLPSCSACNSGNGKWNKFPILGERRIIHPPFKDTDELDTEKCRANDDYLLAEKPAILHPEVDAPEDFFELAWDGILLPKDGGNGRGYHTSSSCDLNRGNLIYARKDLINEVVQNLQRAFFLYRNGDLATAENLMAALKLILEGVFEKTKVQQPYSFVFYSIWFNFENFIENTLSSLEIEESELLLKSYKELI